MATAPTMSAVTIRASVPATMRPALDGAPCPGTPLARFPTAIYLRLPRVFGVIALLTSDAVRLPCGLALPASGRELPLDRLTGPVLVGGGVLRVGDVDVAPGRVVSLALSRRSAPSREALRAAGRLVDVAAHAPPDLQEPSRSGAAGMRLLGRGSGLTPSGDDVLAGYLAAAAAYGLPAGALRALVRRDADRLTTALSAALLRHAAAGEAIPQVSMVLDALTSGRRLTEAITALLAVGHSSGAALAAGVLAAARSAYAAGAAA